MTREIAIKIFNEVLLFGKARCTQAEFKELAEMSIQAIEQKPRWISVEEDTPPIGTICLWCNKQGSVFTSEITYQSEYISRVGKHGYFYNGTENHGNIVAWMPLPKPYKGESEG